MITLYQFSPAFGLPNPSPFCFKVETYLRMIGEPFETKRGNPQKAPKGKLPFIKDGGTVIADSQHIVQHLVKTRGDKLDQGLSDKDRALGHAIRRMVEEGLYFGLVYSRWVEEVGWTKGKTELFAAMPAIARALVPTLARGMVKKQVNAQGTGRHAQEDVFAMMEADVTALAALLGENPYFLGQNPTSVDATAYSFLALMLWSPLHDTVTGAVKKHANLVAYCERMKARYYA